MYAEKFSKLMTVMFYLNPCIFRIAYQSNLYIIKKRLSFLFRFAKHDNLLIKMFYNISGRRELAELAEILNLNVDQLRDAHSDIWACFEKSLFWSLTCFV